MSTKSAKPTSAGYAGKLALYERLVATNPEVERKGDTMPYTSLNGHMFTLLTKEGTLILRLSEGDQDAFIKKYASRNPVQYGAVMREYVEVPDALLAKTRELKKYFDMSHAYVASLKPKPTAKKKKG